MGMCAGPRCQWRGGPANMDANLRGSARWSECVETKPFSDQKPGTSGLAQKGRRSSSSRITSKISCSRFSIRWKGFAGKTLVIGGDGRFYNSAGDPDRHPHRRRQRLRPHRRRPARLAFDAGGLRADPRHRRLSAASSCRRATIRADPTAISASNTISAPAARRRRRSPTRSSRAPRRSPQYKTLDAPDVDLARLGETKVGDATVEIVDPVDELRQLMRKLFDFDAIRGAVQARLPHEVRRHARHHRPLRQGDFRGRTRGRRRRR